MTLNFFVQDFAGGALAAVLLSCVLLVPGWLLAHALDLWCFRERGIACQAALAVTLSVAVAPVLTHLMARATSVRVAGAVWAALALGAAAALLRGAARQGGVGAVARRAWGDGLPRRAALVAAAWAAVALFLLSDTDVGAYLFPNVVAFDYAKHISVTDAIARTGVPPVNPSFRPGHDIGLYYYYLWFLVCSVADVLGGPLVPARAAVLGGTVWAGLAITATVALYLRFVVPPLAAGHAASRRLWAGVALLAVGGLDALASLFAPGPVGFTLEWWNEQVTAWPNAVLWVPHHVGAAVATLTGFLVLRDAEGRALRGRAAAAVVCGLAFASAAGMSVWVTLAFALFWAAWVVVCLLRGWRAEAAVAVAAGVVALAAAAPFLVELVRANLLPATPVAFAVRPFYPVDQALDAMGAGGLRRVVYRLASLPANYLLELGFFAIAAAVYWWRRRLAAHAGRPLGRGELGVLVMAGAALLVASFVKSAIRSNDLGWRSMMFVQFAALLWAADVVPLLARAGAAPRLRAPLRAVLAGALLLGVVAVAYDLAAMKLYPVGRVAGARLFDRQPWSASDYGRQMHDVRSAYAWIDRALPPAALVQPNPAYRGEALYSHIAIDVFQGLYGTRATPAGDPEYGTLYGVPRAMYDSVAAPAVLAFASRDAAAAASLCRGGGDAAQLVKSTDPAWQDRASWVWRARAAYANESARVVPCASLTGAAPISAAGR